MKILITGANGMVARAAIEHCRTLGDEVVALTRAELDISEYPEVKARLTEHRPDAVINCAAYTDVDGAESDTEAARLANAVGPRNLAEACRELDLRFVHISTDYVFDGERSGFYTQRDTPNPIGVYAKTKYQGEVEARNAYARSIIVRSGWIFGHGGSNFLSVMHNLLAEGRTIKAISDAFGTPTFADDLAMRLRELVTLDMPCIFHVTNAGPGVSFEDFALAVCEIGGLRPDLVEPVKKSSLERPAPRPTSSKLECIFSERFGLSPMPDWTDALRRYLK